MDMVKTENRPTHASVASVWFMLGYALFVCVFAGSTFRTVILGGMTLTYTILPVILVMMAWYLAANRFSRLPAGVTTLDIWAATFAVFGAGYWLGDRFIMIDAGKRSIESTFIPAVIIIAATAFFYVKLKRAYSKR